MAKVVRTALSKAARFKVFERDAFVCQYCGMGISEGVVLEVDHIIPVSKGGDNDPVNLTTACYDCNRGKSNRKLGAVPNFGTAEHVAALKEKIELQQERERQLKEYYKFKRRDRDVDAEMINSVLCENLEYELNDRGINSFRYVYKRAGLDIFLDSVDVVIPKIDLFDSADAMHRYLCGVMHNKIRQRDEEVSGG